MKMRWIGICLFLFLSAFSAEINAEPQINQEIVSAQNSYLLTGELGEGSFGRVFSARDSSGELVAIKWYLNAFDYSPGESPDYTFTTDPFWKMLGDIQREYENGQRLNHPNIIRSLDFFSTNEQEHYLVLEFVAGKTIYEIERQEISLSEALKVTFELVDALSYAEAIGFLHMDLHGGNWMINENKEAKLIDLASFFSWKEIEIFETSRTYESPYLRHFNKVEEPMPKFPSPRIKKLQRFFKRHPGLQRKKGHLRQLNYETSPQYNKLVMALYFDGIVGICLNVIDQSGGSKKEKQEKMIPIENLLIPLWDETEETRQALKNFDFRKKMQELYDLLLP